MLLPRSVGGDQVEPWTYLRAIEEIARFDGSVGWNTFVGNSAALIAPYIPLEAARTIYGDPRGLISWGPPNQHRAIAAPGRLPRHRRMAFRLGLAPGQLDRRALPCRRARRLAAAATASAGRPCAPC